MNKIFNFTASSTEAPQHTANAAYEEGVRTYLQETIDTFSTSRAEQVELSFADRTQNRIWVANCSCYITPNSHEEAIRLIQCLQGSARELTIPDDMELTPFAEGDNLALMAFKGCLAAGPENGFYLKSQPRFKYKSKYPDKYFATFTTHHGVLKFNMEFTPELQKLLAEYKVRY